MHGAIHFFAICGNTNGSITQRKSAEYYFHRRLSFTVGSNMIHVSTFDKKDFAVSSKLF